MSFASSFSPTGSISVYLLLLNTTRFKDLSSTISLSFLSLYLLLCISDALILHIFHYLSLPSLCKLQGSRTSLQRYFSLSLSHFYSLPPSMNLCRSYSLFTYYLYLSPSILYLSLLYKGSRTSVPTSLSLSVYCCC